MYGYEYKFLNEWANEGALADFRFANNVVWSQTDDDGSASQEVMTLDTAQFEDGSLEAISNPNGTDETVITFLDEASDWVKGTITDQDGTDTFIPDSSPISATESTTEPYFPDTSYPHSSS